MGDETELRLIQLVEDTQTTTDERFDGMSKRVGRWQRKVEGRLDKLEAEGFSVSESGQGKFRVVLRFDLPKSGLVRLGYSVLVLSVGLLAAAAVAVGVSPETVSRVVRTMLGG